MSLICALALGTTLSVVADYTAHPGKNCYDGHGAVNIDTRNTNSPPRTGVGLADCEAWCTATPCCDAVVYGSSMCYRRQQTVISDCVSSDAKMGTYLKTAPVPPCPAPHPKPLPPPAPPVPYPPAPPVPPAKGGKNVLYVVYDDLRPDLSAYDVTFMKTPNIQKLADTGLTFERAYCQEAVCSPSRNSFSTGRRPNSTKVWNFINHFRNAECATKNTKRAVGTAMVGGWSAGIAGWAQTSTGGHAQCCGSCTAAPGCVGWTYHKNNCTLMSAITGWENCPNGQPLESIDTCVGGTKGAFQKWTPLPANFRENGYMTLGVGKYYHSGGHSAGGAPGDSVHPAGKGTPPLADRYESWTEAGPNGTIQFPDNRPMMTKWGSFPAVFGNFAYLHPDDENCGADYCHPEFEMDGTPPMPPLPGQMPLADFITWNDAITKMRFAAANREATGQPFFLVTGIKRPHLNWRSPAGFTSLYPTESVALPTQLTLDSSIDPVAYSVFPMNAPNGTNHTHGNFVKTPYVHGSDAQIKELRGAYYAAVSWADTATGKILDELDSLKLTADTMVVLHSDHGWHLGEYAMWEKRTNWELGTRVPLIMRVPWMPSSVGKRSRALVELVDVYKTVCDIVGIPLPDDDVPLDGISLRPILEAPATASVKDFALSSFPRCAHIGMPVYGARGAGGADNTCLEVERTDFTWMGHTIRTDRYRYTEWVAWNGTTLSPIWSKLKAAELYDHLEDTGAWTNADKFENINLVTTADKSVVAALSRQLHLAFGFPDDEA